MENDELKYVVALANNPNIGSKTILKLYKTWGSLNHLFTKKNLDKLNSLPISSKIRSEVVRVINDKDPQSEVDKLRKLGISAISIKSSEYPKLLLELPDPPAVLYIKGSLKIANEFCLAVVGSRKYSDYGKRVTWDLTRELAKSGMTIVSGLALGIDAIAHRAALDVGGKTIGVLGCGLDMIYPTEHMGLARQIVQNNGAIISEYPPGTPPYKSNFPLRNRIIAGMSLGTLIVEAAKKSGTLLTAKATLDYNRELFAVPGSIYSVSSEGANNLIKYCAKPVTEVKDILNDLNLETEINVKEAKKIMPDCKEEAEILKYLSSTDAMHVDKLMKLAKLDIATLNAKLIFLEMKGAIRNVGSGNYVIN